MNKPLDLTKPLQTRDGRPAKFLHKLRNAYPYPFVFVITTGETEFIFHSNEYGSVILGTSNHPDDLINVPVKHVREYWVNLYADSCGIFGDKQRADQGAFVHRIACKKITIEFFKNEGL